MALVQLLCSPRSREAPRRSPQELPAMHFARTARKFLGAPRTPRRGASSRSKYSENRGGSLRKEFD